METSKLQPHSMQRGRKRQLPGLWILLGSAMLNIPANSRESPAPSPGKKVVTLEERIAQENLTKEQRRTLDLELTELIRRDPENAALRIARGEFLWRAGRREEARIQWEIALKREPRNARALNHLAGSWLASGEVRRAVGYYRRACEEAPENADYHFALANAAFLFRHELVDPSAPSAEAILSEALTHFAAASRLAPDSEEYARAHAETFYSQAKPDWEAALKAWEHFLKISRTPDFARVNLARVHLKLGQTAAAREQLEHVRGEAFGRLKANLRAQIAAREARSAGVPGPNSSPGKIPQTDH